MFNSPQQKKGRNHPTYLFLAFAVFNTMGKSHKISKETRHEGERKAFQNDKQKGKRNYSKKTSKRNYKSNEEMKLTEELNDMGYTINHMDGDGNCLFRSFADQLINDDSKHFDYRLRIMAHIKKHKDHFSLFVEDDEPFDDYVDRMKGHGEWGGHPELYAASQCLNVNILVHQVDGPRFRLPAADTTVLTEIHLSYHGECHYNSVRSTHPAKTTQITSIEQSKSVTSSDKSRTKSGKQDKLAKKSKNTEKSAFPNSAQSQSDALQEVSAAAPWASVADVLSAWDSLGHCVQSAIDYLVSLKVVDSLSLGGDEEVEEDVVSGDGEKQLSPSDTRMIKEETTINKLTATEQIPTEDAIPAVPESSFGVKTKKEVRDEKREVCISSCGVLNKAGRSMSKKELRQQERQRQQQVKSGVVTTNNSNSLSVSDTQSARGDRHFGDENDGSRVEIVL